MNRLSYTGTDVTAMEAKLILQKLQLRWNAVDNCCEVYTTIHGSGVFKWFKISEATCQEYLKNFPRIPIAARYFGPVEPTICQACHGHSVIYCNECSKTAGSAKRA